MSGDSWHRTEGPATATPAEAFAVLGNETRLSILRTLWEAYRPREGQSPVGFSELHRRVGLSDSGQFNYHLGKLTGHFVRQTDGGYELTPAGLKVVQAVLAGTGIETPSLPSSNPGAACPLCDAPITISYQSQTVLFRCTECSGTWLPGADMPTQLLGGFGFPPSGLRDRSPAEILQATCVYEMNRYKSFLDGVCPECAGTVAVSASACEAHDVDPGAACQNCGGYYLGSYTWICEQCKHFGRAPVHVPVLNHPAATAFYYRHGIEHRTNSWEAYRRGHDIEEELLGTDPLRFRCTIAIGDEARAFTLDETGAVLEVTTVEG